MDGLNEELFIEILLRLPVISLLRCKCVCKLWCSIINTPSFIGKHLLFDHKNNNNLYILVKTENMYHKIISTLSYDNLGVVDDQITQFLHTYPHEVYNKKTPVDCANGLMLLHDYDAQQWIISNLATRETKALPLCLSENKMRNIYPLRDALYENNGIGFDSETKDFKVIMMHRYCDTDPMVIEVEIYNLTTDSWKSIATLSDIKTSPSGVFSNGMYSWITKGRYNDYHEIISLDINKEVIIATSLPDNIICNFYTGSCLLVFNDSLALVNYSSTNPNDDANGTCFDIWTLGEYGVKDSWSKVFTIGPLQGIGRVLGFWKDDKVFVASYDEELFLHDPATQQTMSLQISGKCIKVFTYKESLVPIDQNTPRVNFH